jgi:methionine synthase II (cobalamin-independent)
VTLEVALPPGVATGIGSLPHTDPEAAARLVLERLPALPAAPTLPRRHPAEGMLAQAGAGVAGVSFRPDGSLAVDADRLAPDAALGDPGFDGEGFVGLRTFLAAVRGRTAPIKLQLTGPVTLALALHRAGAPAALALDVARAAVADRARLLGRLSAAEAPSARAVVFLDEPGLTAMSEPEFPLALDDAVDAISTALAALQPWAVSGVHCCGATDWATLLSTGADVISLPLSFSDAVPAGVLDAHLERGGWVAWGAVPTDGPVGSTPDLLWRTLSDRWCELVREGCDAVRLRNQAMITPACGLAMHGESQATRVLTLTTTLAARLREQALGLRLTLGA